MQLYVARSSPLPPAQREMNLGSTIVCLPLAPRPNPTSRDNTRSPCSEVARVRELLAAIDKGADREAAQRQLEDMFSLDVGKAVSALAWLQQGERGGRLGRRERAAACHISMLLLPCAHFAQHSLPPWLPRVSLQSTFGYLQVVNPQVFAELTHAKLDPSSPGEPLV